MKFSNVLAVIFFFIILSGFLGGAFLWRQAFINDSIIETADILRIGGSTTIYPYARAASRAFMDDNSSKIVTVLESSSGGGLAQLLAGQVDIANTTRLPKTEEIAAAAALGKSLVTQHIGYDAVALVVHISKAPYIQSLTAAQARAIFFEGTITEWSQLNPELSGPIHVYARDPNTSGTAAVFGQVVTGDAETPLASRAIRVYITPLVVSTLADDPLGIAYTQLIWTNDQVSTLSYGETENTLIAPNHESIANGSYRLTAPFYVITLGEPSSLAQAYIDYILSEPGQILLQQSGFINAKRSLSSL